MSTDTTTSRLHKVTATDKTLDRIERSLRRAALTDAAQSERAEFRAVLGIVQGWREPQGGIIRPARGTRIMLDVETGEFTREPAQEPQESHQEPVDRSRCPECRNAPDTTRATCLTCLRGPH